MRTPLPPLDRRRLLGMLAALPLTSAICVRLSTPARATPAIAAVPFPDGPMLLVAGPAGSHADQWASLLTPELARVLPAGPGIRTVLSGGTDGVTAANQFDARAEPDGSTVLLLPGATFNAWLVGDPRAHFDVGQWVTVFSALTHGVVCSRLPVTAGSTGRPIRLAAASPTGAALPALLAFEMLGIQVVPVFGLQTAAQACDALRQGAVDAVFAQGRGTALEVATLQALGANPIFSLGLPDPAGQIGRDPLFPNTPTMPELFIRTHGVPPSGPLYAGWCATALAAQLDAAAVLPQLTPAGMVALWRRGCDQSVASLTVQAAASSLATRPLATPGAAMAMASIAADSTALLELRRWLAARFNWQPA